MSLATYLLIVAPTVLAGALVCATPPRATVRAARKAGRTWG